MTEQIVTYPWRPTIEETASIADAVAAAIHQAIGSASMCWEGDLTEAGRFDSEQATAIGEGLERYLRELWLPDTPRLGLATTRELLAELAARIDLDYRTVEQRT